jgi:hypothetical protein
MTIILNYSGTRYELAANVDAHQAFSQIVDRLNHSWRRQQTKTARPDDSGAGYIADDYDPWVHFRLATGGTISLHIHDSMHVVFENTEAT